MDEELRRLEHAARTSGESHAWLAWASALKRAGRVLEAARAALEARSRGASPEAVFPIARPREGGGDLAAPWPHVRGSSAATGRSRVEGPTAGAGVLFRYRFEAGAVTGARMPLRSSPLVLPDGTVLVLLEHGPGFETSLAVALDPSGQELWRASLTGAGPPGTLLATGELVLDGEAALVRLDPLSGRVLARSAPRPPSSRLEAVDESEVESPARARVSERCAAWETRVLVRQSVLEAGRAGDLRAAKGERLLTRAAPIATPDGWAFLLAQTYSMSPSGRWGAEVPDVVLYPLEVFAYGPDGDLRWTAPIAAPATRQQRGLLVAGASQVHAVVGPERFVLERATGRVAARAPAPVPYLALDPNDEPVPLAPFGPPLASPPVVDSSGRRYAGTRRGTVVGLGPAGEPLFEVTVAAAASSSVAGGADGRLAIGPGRLYLVLDAELVCIGNR